MINPLFSLYHGTYFLGLFARYTSFSFGSARSCLKFQQYTSLIVHVTKILLGTKYFASNPGLAAEFSACARRLGLTCLANYLDDNFTISCTLKISDKVFDMLEATTEWVGGKMSAKKKMKSKKSGQVLGLIIQCGDEKKAGMRLPEDKTLNMRELINELEKKQGAFDHKKLERLAGMMCWLSYYSDTALLYSLPIVALRWLPCKVRALAFLSDHPLFYEIDASIKWWKRTLKCSNNMPYIWRANAKVKNWIRLTSDASSTDWGIHDHRSIYLMGSFIENDDRPIATKELSAINEYIEFADVRNSGLHLLCDNMQVYWSVRKKAVSPSTDSSFKQQIWRFARNCEKRCLRVVMDWISTHHNLSTDLSSRHRPILALETASAIAGRKLSLYGDDNILEQAKQEIRSILCVP